MIKELLERNGYKVYADDITACFIGVVVEKGKDRELINIGVTKDTKQAEELACRQYVKNKWFDIAWIKDMVQFPRLEYYVTDMSGGTVYGMALRIEDENGEPVISCDTDHMGRIDVLELNSNISHGDVPQVLFKIIAWLYTEGVQLRGRTIG